MRYKRWTLAGMHTGSRTVETTVTSGLILIGYLIHPGMMFMLCHIAGEVAGRTILLCILASMLAVNLPAGRGCLEQHQQ